MTDQLTITDLRTALLSVCEALDSARAELGRLDAVAGDGDLGATLAAGFSFVRELLQERNFDDIGSMLTAVGRELGRRAPSTMGTLLSFAFRRMGAASAGATFLNALGVASVLAAAGSAIQERGQVTVGQRTVLDAVEASAAAAHLAATRTTNIDAVLVASAKAARDGAKRTAQLAPQVGRAAWIGARVIGTPDAGATAWAVVMEALADSATHANRSADIQAANPHSGAPSGPLY